MGYEIVFLYKAQNYNPVVRDRWHTNASNELVYYLKGEGYVQTEGKTLRYRSGDMILVPQGVLHNEINEVPHTVIVLGFRYKGNYPPKLPKGKFTPPRSVCATLESMLEEMVERKSYYREVLLHQLECLIYGLLRTGERGKSTDFASIIQNIDNYIEDNLARQISIDDFAKIYNYSPSRFRHLFTEETGIPPKQYVIKKRLDRATKMLMSSDRSMTDISQECGFYDSAQFSKMFKKYIGINPSKYRNNNNTTR